DVALFAALIAALELAPAWKRRLIKDFNHKSSLAHDLERLTISAAHARPEYQGVLAALAGSDPKAAHALVTDLLSIARITADGRHRRGRRPLGRGDRRPLPRAGRTRRADLAAAGDPRADREISRHRRRPRRGGGRAARLRPRAQGRARRRARPLREPHRLSRR